MCIAFPQHSLDTYIFIISCPSIDEKKKVMKMLCQRTFSCTACWYKCLLICVIMKRCPWRLLLLRASRLYCLCCYCRRGSQEGQKMCWLLVMPPDSLLIALPPATVARVMLPFLSLHLCSSFLLSLNFCLSVLSHCLSVLLLFVCSLSLSLFFCLSASRVL